MPSYDAERFNPPAPIAKIILRNPADGNTVSDIPMLIDTGADISLIPQYAVIRLGMTALSGESYKLMGFDGNITDAPVIRLDMSFMKKTFRGLFLIIEKELGILGRDVLNHISIILNGPLLTWNEHKNQ